MFETPSFEDLFGQNDDDPILEAYEAALLEASDLFKLAQDKIHDYIVTKNTKSTASESAHLMKILAAIHELAKHQLAYEKALDEGTDRQEDDLDLIDKIMDTIRLVKVSQAFDTINKIATPTKRTIVALNDDDEF